MVVQATRTFESYADGDPIVVDVTKNIVAVTGTPTANTAAATHGTKGARCHSGVVGGEAVSYGALPVDARSVYGEIQTAGAGTATVAAVKNGSTFIARIRANPTGTQWELTNFDGSSVLDSTTIDYAVGTPFRIDMLWTYSAPNITVEARIFQGGNVEGYVPDETLGPNTFAAASSPNRWAFGTINSAWAIDFDSVREYGDTSAWPVPWTASASLSQRPVMEVGTTVGWTGVSTNTTAGRVAALADESDATYVQSAASGTSTLRHWLGAGIVPDSDNLLIRVDETAPGGTLHFKLYEGRDSSAALEDITVTVTTTLSNFTVGLAPATVAAVDDWTNLYYDLIAT